MGDREGGNRGHIKGGVIYYIFCGGKKKGIIYSMLPPSLSPYLPPTNRQEILGMLLEACYVHYPDLQSLVLDLFQVRKEGAREGGKEEGREG